MSDARLSEYYKQKNLITFVTSDPEALKVREKWKITCFKCLAVEPIDYKLSLKNALQIWSMGGWSHVGGNPLCPQCTTGEG